MLFEYTKGHPQDILDKSELVVGKTYKGICRSTDEATWNGTEFEYEHTEWYGDTFTKTLPHPEDDKSYDVFLPLREMN